MPLGRDALGGDPLVVYNYSVEVGGMVTGYFTEASGLGSEHEVVEHKIVGAGGKEAIRKIPGRLKWGDITLKRGLTQNMDIWTWRKMVEDGNVTKARTDGSIVGYDQEGQEQARWNFEKGWPSKVSGPSLKSDGNEIGIEELTIVHEGIKRVK